jgi:hypothetical protein
LPRSLGLGHLFVLNSVTAHPDNPGPLVKHFPSLFQPRLRSISGFISTFQQNFISIIIIL